nr:hypothetical protein Q903MT_gene3108 [Picea sitchensis]
MDGMILHPAQRDDMMCSPRELHLCPEATNALISSR